MVKGVYRTVKGSISKDKDILDFGKVFYDQSYSQKLKIDHDFGKNISIMNIDCADDRFMIKIVDNHNIEVTVVPN